MKEPDMYPCSLCGEPMDVIPDKTGVTVKCNRGCDSHCHENVFGHGKNVKDAWEISKQKFIKPAK